MNANLAGYSTSTNTSPGSSRLVSIPFLIVALALGVGAYFSGPTIMAYYFLWSDPVNPEAIPAANVSSERPSFPSNGNGNGKGREFGGGGTLSQDPVQRAKRRPPAEFDEETKPTDEAATLPVSQG